MPFSSQFALSLELTRLVPLRLIGSKAAEAVMNLARDLQNSGSDIVVEEDLAHLFGRNRITPQFETSFKTAVAKTETTKTFNGIDLQVGAGPTVVRSLQNGPYFSTIVQCSLLSFYHERWSLAGVLHQIFEKQMEDMTKDAVIRAAPSQEGLAGFLEACVNQTAGYDWWRNIEAVAALLDNPSIEKSAIPPSIVRGAVYMFAMVQSLPDDRLVVIQTLDGIYPLIVWAHHVLGLTVSLLLRDPFDNVTTSHRFGGPHDQVIIETPTMGPIAPVPPSITLMECNNMDTNLGHREVLFKISADPDEEPLYAAALHPAKGFAKAFLRFQEDPEHAHKAMERHLCILAGALALRISQHCVFRYGGAECGEDEIDSDASESGLEGSERKYNMDETALLSAMRVLCDESRLEMRDIRECEQLHLELEGAQFKCSNFTLKLIATTKGIDVKTGAATIQAIWNSWQYKISCLAATMLAAAHIQELNDSADVLFSADHRVISSTRLADIVLRYEAGQTLDVSALDFLGAIQTLALGSYGGFEDEFIGADVFSCHGWSIFRNILGPPDPTLGLPFGIGIKRGTPCRNGVYRRAIIQGPLSSDPHSNEWLLENVPGETVTLQCANVVAFRPPIIGDRRDCFVVNLRLEVRHSDDLVRIHRTGYRELQEAISLCENTSACHHRMSSQQTALLPTGFRSFSDFASLPNLNLDCRVALILTSNNAAARWRALIAAAKHCERRILLRGRDCCLDCTVLQAAELDCYCYVIL